ncbi:hypothetical protein ABZP36_032583 [Zizania latifolia]
MGKPPVTILFLCFLLALAVAAATSIGPDHEQDAVSTYIVHVMPAHAPRPSMPHRAAAAARLSRAYTSFLRDLLLPEHVARPAPRLLYSYAHAATGFAARLTARQAAHLEAQPCIAAVVPDTVYEPHTTLSSSFLHLSPSSGLQAESNGATDAVIAVLDTGVYPEGRASFAPDSSTAHLIPAATVPYDAGVEILRYMVTTPYPVGKILFFGTVIGSSPSAPRVASFSGRGPSIPAPEILKPDVVAPGVDILAAWTGLNSPTELDVDPRRVMFNIYSGTSMAAPHVSGIAALLKKARPRWSPAVIQSALTTTAYDLDSAGDAIKDMATGKVAGPFELGAGHVDPNRALDPGLVYDAGEDDYLYFLCGLGYSQEEIDGIFTRDGSVTNCSTKVSSTLSDLNRATFSVVFKAYGDSLTLHRIVRNVGSNVDAVYNISGVAPPGTQLRITPSKLVFDAEHPTRMYTVVFSTVSSGNFTTYTHGSIVLSDGVHKVRSPIAVIWPSQSAAFSAM